MTQPELVFAENSPYDSVEALIEQDSDVAYFYLRATDETNRFGLKSCWIRNLVEAPEGFDSESLQAGKPPLLPRQYCRFPAGQPRLDESRLKLVWFEEGDGAALLEDDQVLAVIPAWSEIDQFHGFARDCVGQSPLCWEWDSSAKLSERIQQAELFWRSWETDQSPWLKWEPELIKAYQSAFGEPSAYFAIEEQRWPPRAVARFDFNGAVVLTTVGASLCPQPQVELHLEHPQLMRRFELACGFSRDVPESSIGNMIRYLSGQTYLPWSQIVFLAHGHTVSCDLFLSDEALPDFSSVLLWEQNGLGVDSQVQNSTLQTVKMPPIGGDPVNLLWMLPLFENERLRIRDSGSELVGHQIIDQSSAQTPGIPVIGHRPIVS